MKTQISVPKAKLHCGIKYIAIFGSADIDENHPLYQEVFIVARYLAYHNKVVVDGGGPGVMAAATAGAKSAGGTTLAVTFYPTDMPEFEGRFGENHVDKEIKTSNYIERMFGLMSHADAFIIFQGGTGTLSEWATAWLLGHLYYGNHKPIILYGAFWEDILQVVNDRMFIGEKEKQVYKIVKNEQEMIAALNAFEKELEDRCGLPRPTPENLGVVGTVSAAEEAAQNMAEAQTKVRMPFEASDRTKQSQQTQLDRAIFGSEQEAA